MNFHVNNIYIHEVALHPEHDPEDFRPPFFVTATSNKVKTSLGPAYVNAINKCITSAQTVIKIFLGMNVETLRAVPAMLYVRIIYSSIILIKLDVSAKSADSEIGKLLDRDSLMTRVYIEKTLAQMKRVAGTENKYILAAKFCMIFGKLVLWYRQIMQSDANEVRPQPFAPFKEFSSPYMPDEILSDPQHFPTTKASTPLPDSMASAMAAPPMPHPGTAFASFSSFSGAPQYPTPGHSPFPALANSANTTSTERIPGLSAPYNARTPQSIDHSSPELADQSDLQFSVPMEIDPSMFDQLQGADPSTYNQVPNNWMFEGMDYSNLENVPDFDWLSIPEPQ